MEMAFFDITVTIVIIFCLINSLTKGMIKEIFALIAYALGFLAARHFNDQTVIYLKDYAGGDTGGKVLGFFLVFIFISLLVKLIGRWIQKVMYSNGELSFLDRTFGALLGLAKGVFIIAIIMILIELFPSTYKKITSDSVLAPYLEKVSGYLRQNLFSKDNLNKTDKSLGLRVIDKSIFDIKQIGKLKKKLPPPKVTSGLKESPQDDYSEASREELESLLKEIQKQ